MPYGLGPSPPPPSGGNPLYGAKNPPWMVRPDMRPSSGLLDVRPSPDWQGPLSGLLQPVGDVIDARRRFMRGLLHSPDALSEAFKRGVTPPAGGGSPTATKPPSAKDTPSFSLREYGRLLEQSPRAASEYYRTFDPRLSLADKQRAEAKTLDVLRKGNEAFDKKWGDWGKSVGLDPALTTSFVRRLFSSYADQRLPDPTDNQVKYLTQVELRQRGPQPQ